MALALITKGHTGGPHAVTIVDGHLEHGRAGTVPHLGHGLIGGGLDGSVNVSLGGGIALGDEQGDGILGLTALLGGSGGGQVGIGEADLTSQDFHGIILIHNLLISFTVKLHSGVCIRLGLSPAGLKFHPALMPGFAPLYGSGQPVVFPELLAVLF